MDHPNVQTMSQYFHFFYFCLLHTSLIKSSKHRERIELNFNFQQRFLIHTVQSIIFKYIKIKRKSHFDLHLAVEKYVEFHHTYIKV
jgi:hypothetical protein